MASLNLQEVILLRRLLKHRSSVNRGVVSGYDIYGSPIVTPTQVASAIPCLWQASKSENITDDRRLLHLFEARVWFEVGANIQAEDLLTITTKTGQAATRRERWTIKTIILRTDPTGGRSHLEAGVEAYS